MVDVVEHERDRSREGNDFSCAMTAVLLARVHAFGGEEAVLELLEVAGSARSSDYLLDIANWVSYDEAVALWEAGASVTGHPQFARAVGEDAARRLNGSPVAALFRSLGSPENVYRQIATSSSKYSVVTELEAVAVGPGFADIVARAVDGFPRNADHCAWTCGLLTQPTLLFGLPAAEVEHERCAALGAPDCHYRVTWRTAIDDLAADASAETAALRGEIEAMRERLRSIFETAADLIAAGEINEVLARITDRAAVEVRAPRYLLAIRTTPDDEVHYHHRGLTGREAARYAEEILGQQPAALPDSWLVVPVSSSRRDYGRLVAMYEEGRQFFPEERELFEVYARYAASALDSATALLEARQRYRQSSALLGLARALAVAGTSGEVARRLAEAVPMVVDCDRVGVYLWEPARGELVRRASTHSGSAMGDAAAEWSRTPSPGGVLERLLSEPRAEPMFIDRELGDTLARELFSAIGAVASILVPLVTPDQFLGLLSVSAMDAPQRLEPNPDLLDRLSGVAAQATTALQNGRLVDEITRQALRDGLTGLANRVQFANDLRNAIHRARPHFERVTVFYLDLDRFKPVNDEFGHETGDELLIAVAERLRSCVRAGDTVARLGGDEFAVLIDTETTSSDADAVADRLAGAFTHRFALTTHELMLTASIGRAEYPGDADSAESLLRVADNAMFESKRAGQERQHHVEARSSKSATSKSSDPNPRSTSRPSRIAERTTPHRRRTNARTA
jgi:diguanylate cyclase (GGDEF)-like protein